jgi:2-iminobutanoate/2-iminopropanoate deaminase
MAEIKKIYTKNAPDAIGPYSQATVVNGMVYTSGQIAINPATGNVEAADIVGQTEQIFKNLAAVLEEAGSSLDKVVRTMCFLADVEKDFGDFNKTYEKFITGKPARSCVGVKALPKNVLAEVEVIAVVD